MSDKILNNQTSTTISSMPDQLGLIAAPIEATTKMLNAGVEAGAKDIHQAENIYASMLLAGTER